MYEISDGLETPEFDFPAVPSKHNLGSSANLGSFASTTSNGRVSEQVAVKLTANDTYLHQEVPQERFTYSNMQCAN